MLLLPLNAGCGLFELETQNQTIVDSASSTTDIQKKIIDSLQDATKADCETIYKVFSGISMYTENSSKLNKVSDVLKLIGFVEEDYRWSTDTYKTLTDVIEADLTEKGYAEDKEISGFTNGKLRVEVVALFKEYADAVLVVLKAKHD